MKSKQRVERYERGGGGSSRQGGGRPGAPMQADPLGIGNGDHRWAEDDGLRGRLCFMVHCAEPS